MYILVEHSDSYSKHQEVLNKLRDKLALNANDADIDFPAANNNSAFFNFKQKITGKAGADNAKDVEIIVPLKYLDSSNLVR